MSHHRAYFRFPAAFVVANSAMLVAAGTAYGGVIVCDVTGAGDYNSVQAAINAAATGDILLLKHGSFAYDFFGVTIDGKSLVIVADAGAPSRPKLAGITVKNLPPSGAVIVRGIEVQPATGFGPPVGGITIDHVQGGVVFEDCVLRGSPGVGQTFGFSKDALPGVVLTSCAAAVFTRCSIFGGSGVDAGGIGGPPSYYGSSGGGAGVVMAASHASFHDCVVAGGAGGKGNAGIGIANDGGDGAVLVGSVVLLSGTAIAGGAGGSNGASAPSGDINAGGDGLRTDAASKVFAIDSSWVGGDGGPFPFGAGFGPDGVALDPPGFPIGGWTTQARSFSLSTPVKELTSVAVDVRGQTGDLVLLVQSFGVANLHPGGVKGWLLLTPPLLGPFVLLAISDPSGHATLTVPAPPLALPTLEGFPFLFQAFFTNPGETVAGPPSLFVLLDA